MKGSITLTAAAAAILALALPLSAQEEAQDKPINAPNLNRIMPANISKLEIVEIEPFTYAAIEMTGSYEQHAQAFMQLYTAAGQQGVPMNEAPFGIYHNSPDGTPEEELKWEIGMPVPSDTKLASPIVIKKWEYTSVIRRDFEGAIDSEEMEAVYRSMQEWIAANGYEMAGPMMERFLNMPSTNDKGETIGKVQIVFPVEKK